MKNGSHHAVLVHSIDRLGSGLVHTVIASDPWFLEELDNVGFAYFVDDAENCDPPDNAGLWLASFQYTEDAERWTVTQVTSWVRLTAKQAEALAQGKPFTEVVAA